MNATWTIADSGGGAALSIRPFIRLTARDKAELSAEGARLLSFTNAGAKTHDIRFVD